MTDQKTQEVKYPATYWRHRRTMSYASLLFGFFFALTALIADYFFEIKGFPIVAFSTVLYLFLIIPIVIYMTGATKEDIEKIKGIIEVMKK